MTKMFDAYRNCRLCPRDCGVDRISGARGYCGETSVCRIASSGPHFGEEPSFSGTRGSGTIFFTGCSSHCFFCQNYQISNENQGDEVTLDALFAMAKTLAASGVHNLNFVTPDHFWPHIESLCVRLKEAGVNIPRIFNGSGYQREDMIGRYAQYMDIFMSDFKFAQGRLAKRCMGDDRYPEIAIKALRKMVELKGFLDPWDPSGACPAQQGVLVRHLILPGEVENSLEVLRLLREEFGRLIPLSVMSQFQPVSVCHERGELTRPITAEEYARVQDLVLELDFRHVYMQTLSHTSAFLPDFNRDEPFEGNRGKGEGASRRY